MICPACKSTDVEISFPRYSGTCVTSDMMVLEDASIENALCRSCGLIFNNKGTRGFTESFYRSSYSLMRRSKESSIRNFSSGRQISQAELTNNILLEMADLGDEGIVLEAGAGKGEFLGYFKEKKPEWTAYAFEPSASYEELSGVLTEHYAQKCEYFDYNLNMSEVDLVVALGVLEHVEDPLEMMIWAAKRLKVGGYFYVRVPNFENNPNDLFCVDHLSKLTELTLRSLAEHSGFEVLSVEKRGVPIFILLRKIEINKPLRNVFLENSAILGANVNIASASMGAVLKAREMALESQSNLAIFGLGASGLFAPYYGNFPLEEIAVYIDENQSLWGSSVHGRPVAGLEGINKFNVGHIALAISPVYHEIVSKKLADFDVRVYAAD